MILMLSTVFRYLDLNLITNGLSANNHKKPIKTKSDAPLRIKDAPPNRFTGIKIPFTL